MLGIRLDADVTRTVCTCCIDGDREGEGEGVSLYNASNGPTRMEGVVTLEGCLRLFCKCWLGMGCNIDDDDDDDGG